MAYSAQGNCWLQEVGLCEHIQRRTVSIHMMVAGRQVHCFEEESMGITLNSAPRFTRGRCLLADKLRRNGQTGRSKGRTWRSSFDPSPPWSGGCSQPASVRG